MFYFLLLLILGYLIGSISPGYFFGWLVRKIDIRDYGNLNTGATNTFHIIGRKYGVITAIIDILKAPLVYYISIQWLDPNLAIIVGLIAVVGHIAPFYLDFRGGRGIASLFGLILIASFFSDPLYILMLVIGGIIYAISIASIPIHISFRHFLKLAAVIFPLGLILFSQELIGNVLLILFFTSLSFDILRLVMPRLNKKYLSKSNFAKEKERKRFSGYTLFLASAFLVIAFFPKEIAVISLIYFIIGDFFAPMSKAIQFLPQKKILYDRTIAGAVTIFTTTLSAGLLLMPMTTLSLSLPLIIYGALLVTFFDHLSFLLDDNILVPLGTALVLLSFNIV